MIKNMLLIDSVTGEHLNYIVIDTETQLDPERAFVPPEGTFLSDPEDEKANMNFSKFLVPETDEEKTAFAEKEALKDKG